MSQDSQFQDPFEMLKKLWAPMGLPLAPLLDLNDIEKRISDLKSVEAWLGMNLNVLRMTIQGLEMQKATLSAFQAMQPKPAPAPSEPPPVAAASSPPLPSPVEAWWDLLREMQSPAPGPKPEPKPEKKRK